MHLNVIAKPVRLQKPNRYVERGLVNRCFGKGVGDDFQIARVINDARGIDLGKPYPKVSCYR
jgi:succinylglutamate desuccinylase